MLRIFSVVSCVAVIAMGSAAVAGPVKAKSSQSQLQVSTQSLPLAGGLAGASAGTIIAIVGAAAVIGGVIINNTSGSH